MRLARAAGLLGRTSWRGDGDGDAAAEEADEQAAAERTAEEAAAVEFEPCTPRSSRPLRGSSSVASEGGWASSRASLRAVGSSLAGPRRRSADRCRSGRRSVIAPTISSALGSAFASAGATTAMIMPGRAVAALERLGLEERLLDRVEPAVLLEALDRDDLLARGLGDRRLAGRRRLAVEQHRAGAALPLAAAVLGAGQVEAVAQDREERLVGAARRRARGLPLTVRTTAGIRREFYARCTAADTSPNGAVRGRAARRNLRLSSPPSPGERRGEILED